MVSYLFFKGILGIFAVAAFNRSFRAKTGTKVLLQLSLSIMLQIIFVLFTDNGTDYVKNEECVKDCVIRGVINHYLVMTTFFWMLITSFMQYKRYVVVLGNLIPSNFLKKSSLFGWLAPAIPVLILLIVNHRSYIPKSNGICYPHGLGFRLAVLLPILLILLTNLSVFGVVLHNIFSISSIPRNSTNSRKTILDRIRVSFFLFFLLGFTWTFGLLRSLHYIFTYLFCLTTSLQGFVLFFFFIVMNPEIKIFKCVSKVK